MPQPINPLDSEADLAAGVRLGPYEIVAPLGTGGMGKVVSGRGYTAGPRGRGEAAGLRECRADGAPAVRPRGPLGGRREPPSRADDLRRR